MQQHRHHTLLTILLILCLRFPTQMASVQLMEALVTTDAGRAQVANNVCLAVYHLKYCQLMCDEILL